MGLFSGLKEKFHTVAKFLLSMIKMEGMSEQLEILPQEEKKSFAIISDPHYERRGPYDVEDEIKRIEKYSDQYDCEELLVAGDIGTLADIECLIDSDFEKKRLVPGNHDRWNKITLEKNSLLPKDVDCEEKLNWTIDVGKDEYQISMSHRPHDFGTRVSYLKGIDNRHHKDDILIHGHSHMSHYRPLENSLLALGCGSTYRNFYTPPSFPDKSFQILDINSKVKVREIDLEEDDVVLEKIFQRENGCFKEKKGWKRGYYDKLFGEYVNNYNS